MKKNIYDNSNISESYAGVTTPLTFSFVRHIYEQVYREFSLLMGVRRKEVMGSKFFKHMVEFIGGRIYYNLNSWYRMLSFFPGYKFSSDFMEKMMGVSKSYDYKTEKSDGLYEKKFIVLPKLLFQGCKIVLIFVSLKWRIPQFNKKFDQIFLKTNTDNLDNMNIFELRKNYQRTERELLSQWKIPIANDFAVMVSAGLSDKLFRSWLNSMDAYAHMKTSVRKPLISLDPGNKLIEIAKLIKQDKRLLNIFLFKDERGILESLNREYKRSTINQEIEVFLKKYGARMPNELKLEEVTLAEKPEKFISLIKRSIDATKTDNKSFNTKLKSERYRELPVIKRLVLNSLLKWAGESIRRREETRFRRVLIFGYVRRVFILIGKRLVDEKVIENKRDIFYLSMEEIFSYIDEPRLINNFFKIVENRKKKYTRWKKFELPRRFETTKGIFELEKQILSDSVYSVNKREKFSGMVASVPGNIRKFEGRAITLKDFEPTADFSGKILVTRQTDPGWTVIFPLLKGIVVERGGMLSHAAIVARELNIPCIVGVENATNLIEDNSLITLNLEDGSIILNSPD